MQICKEFIIREVLDYELNNDINIFDELTQGNLFIVLDLIKLGNKCDDAEAESIFNKSIEEVGYDKTVENLAYELVGKRPDEKEESTDSKKYSSFSEVLEDFYKIRDTLIAEGYSYPDNFEAMCNVEETLYVDLVLKKKKVNISAFDVLNTVEDYNKYSKMVGGIKRLTKKEFELIKRWLNEH